MADKKDKKTPDNGTTPAISTSSSLDKPLLDEDTAEIHPEIDTSHLSLEEDSHSPKQDTAVDDFELNDNEAADDSPLNIPPDKMEESNEPLYVSNPLAGIDYDLKHLSPKQTDNLRRLLAKGEAGEMLSKSDLNDLTQLRKEAKVSNAGGLDAALVKLQHIQEQLK